MTLASRAQHFNKRKARKCGLFAFSLIEILVVIAVLAILLSIAIPTIRHTLQLAAESKNRRNAQHLATISAAMISAGHKGTNSVNSWITMLTNGESVTNSFGETIGYFRSDDLNPDDITALSPYISITNSQLIYRPEGSN